MAGVNAKCGDCMCCQPSQVIPLFYISAFIMDDAAFLEINSFKMKGTRFTRKAFELQIRAYLSLSFILLLYSLVISLVFLLAHSLSLSLCSISIEDIHTHQKFFMTGMENIVKLQLKTATNIIAVDAKRFVFFSGCCVVFERNFEQYAQPTISMHSFVYSKMCAS